MESIREKISKFIKGIQEKLIPPFNLKGYKLVEHQKKIFYFCKFSLDTNEFYHIYLFILNVKEKIFTSLYKDFKNCIQNFIEFKDKNLHEKDKIMILFSALFFHYYSSFSYDTNNLFIDYFNVNLIKLCENFKFQIKNIPKFQSFAFDFYKQMQATINSYNYEKIKKYYKYYNSNLISIENENNNDLLNIQNLHNNKNSIKNLQKKILIQLIAAKERIVDMVFEIKTKNDLDKNPDEMQFLQTSLEKINELSKEHLNDSNDKMIIDSSINNNSDSESDKEINKIVQSINSNNITEYSKRVLCELTKCEIDDNTNLIINKLSEKINELYLDKVLNKDKEYKNIILINHFFCYVVEFNSELIKNIDNNSNNNSIYNDINLRYIVPAKEFYNLLVEIYFSIFDLSYTNINTYFEICLKKGIQMKYAANCFHFFRQLTKLLVNFSNANNPNKIFDMFQLLYDLEFDQWEKDIKEKGQQLTSFCKI